MQSCLIFGGNGFIGSHLTEKLIKLGYNVRVFDKFKNGKANLRSVKSQIEMIEGDFTSSADISHALKNVDYVFHYISTTIPATAKKDPVYDIESNICSSVKLFQSAINSNVQKVIFASSGGTIYGEPVNLPIREMDPLNPIDPYGISKLAIEKYLFYFNNVYGLDYQIFRYSNPYGERQDPNGKQGVIPIFLGKIRQGEQPVIYGNGSMIRDYIYIGDAIDATMAVLESKTSEKIFNVGSGEGTSINELIKIISRVIGKNIEPTYVKVNGTYIQKVILDISKIQKQTGWRPSTNLKDGIERTWEWIKSTY